MISFTPSLCQKHEVWLRFFAKNAQNNPKTHSYEDNANFTACFWLSYAMRFQRKQWVIENFEYLGEFEDFWKCWLYCILYLCISDWKMLKKVFEKIMKTSCMCTCKVPVDWAVALYRWASNGWLVSATRAQTTGLYQVRTRYVYVDLLDILNSSEITLIFPIDLYLL
jgi:hypothetical protein